MDIEELKKLDFKSKLHQKISQTRKEILELQEMLAILTLVADDKKAFERLYEIMSRKESFD